MRIVIPGGSGQVGTLLARAFVGGGHDVVVLSRQPVAAPWRVVAWDGRNGGTWERELDGADVVINLTGRSVNCRYNERNRREILESRVRSATIVGEAIARCTTPPPVWLQASTATIYSHRFDAPNDDETGLIGGTEVDAPPAWQFSIDVAQAWERAAIEACPASTRLVLLRSSMIMSPDAGGIFATLLRLVKLGLGGSVASGAQYVSWIHEHDFVRAVDHLIAVPQLNGPVIVAAPSPLPYRDFMRAIRDAIGMPIGLPATRWMLEIGTRLLGTESELVLKSRRVVPSRLLASGFAFTHPEWRGAVSELVTRSP